MFPYEAIKQAGYHAAVFGQRTYNGVAVLGRVEPQNIRLGMDDGVEDAHARLIAARVGNIEVVSAYIPNGQVVGTNQYAYKLEWLKRLRVHLDRHFTPMTPLVICGDFNLARDERDVAKPAAWDATVQFHPTARAALEELLSWGLLDVQRAQHPDDQLYTWWDYRSLAFPKNDGLRLDYIFATAPLAARCVSAETDREERKGEKPSDHAPVVAVFD